MSLITMSGLWRVLRDDTVRLIRRSQAGTLAYLKVEQSSYSDFVSLIVEL